MDFDRKGKKTLKNTMCIMINNKFLSDIRFQFDDGQILYAHSFILCVRSQEFYNLLKSEIGNDQVIPIKNIPFYLYHIFIKYLYMDEINSEYFGDIQPDLVKLAMKHNILNLLNEIQAKFSKTVDEEDVAGALEIGLQENWIWLQEISLNHIQNNYRFSMWTHAFNKINQETLKCILKLDKVSFTDEFVIFEYVCAWAKKKCEQYNESFSGFAMRKYLGDCLKLIRFPAMMPEHFRKIEKNIPGLLTNTECLAIYRNMVTGETNSFGFPDKKRQYLHSVQILPSTKHISVDLTKYIRILKRYDTFVEYSMEFSVRAFCQLLKISFDVSCIIERIDAIENGSNITIFNKQIDYSCFLENNETLWLQSIHLKPKKHYKMFYKVGNPQLLAKGYELHDKYNGCEKWFPIVEEPYNLALKIHNSGPFVACFYFKYRY